MNTHKDKGGRKSERKLEEHIIKGSYGLEGLYDKENVWHVYPINDIKQHRVGKLTGFCCECNPKLSLQENRGLIIIHNAFDGRHILEKGQKFN